MSARIASREPAPAASLPAAALSPRTAAWRWAELAMLFALAPAILAVTPTIRFVIPLLVGGAIVVSIFLGWDRSFDRRSLYRVGPAPSRELARFGAVWLAAIALLTPTVALASPDSFLGLPRERPRLWVAIMLFYPLLSVYPQELIFRAFFFHRYAPILRTQGRLIIVNALAFGLAHALFLNGIAIGMTVIGGALFAWTYSRTRSIPLVSLEHALYGCFIFTVGLGEFFYAGAVR